MLLHLNSVTSSGHLGGPSARGRQSETVSMVWDLNRRFHYILIEILLNKWTENLSALMVGRLQP